MGRRALRLGRECRHAREQRKRLRSELRRTGNLWAEGPYAPSDRQPHARSDQNRLVSAA